MTLKVIRGTVQPQNLQTQAKNTAVRNTAAQTVTSAATSGSSEATTTTLKFSRGISQADKVRDAKEAKDLAESVADDIRAAGEEAEVHTGLSSESARQHFLPN